MSAQTREKNLLFLLCKAPVLGTFVHEPNSLAGTNPLSGNVTVKSRDRNSQDLAPIDKIILLIQHRDQRGCVRADFPICPRRYHLGKPSQE